MSDKYELPSETAKRIRSTEQALAHMRFRGDGPPFIKLNQRAVRYRVSDVDAWLAERTRTQSSRRD